MIRLLLLIRINQNSRIHPGRSSSKKIEDDQQHYCPRRPGGQQKIWFRTIFHLTQTQFLSLKHSVKWKVRTSGRPWQKDQEDHDRRNRGSSWVSRKGHTTFLLLPLTSGGSGNSGILHSSWGTGGKRYQWGWGIEDGTKEELWNA